MDYEYVIDSIKISELVRIKHKDVLKNIRNDIKKLNIFNKEKYCIESQYFIKVNNGAIKYNPMFKLTLEGVKLYIDNRRKTLSIKPLIEWYNQNSNNIENSILYNRPEIEFLNKLEVALQPFNIKGERQHLIKNNKEAYYRIDYYISQLNIAIEYDENNHDYYTYEQHEGRQEYIEKKLKCKFIRVNNSKSDEFNIGQVIKEIFDFKSKKMA